MADVEDNLSTTPGPLLGLEILERSVESYPIHMLYKMIEFIREKTIRDIRFS